MEIDSQLDSIQALGHLFNITGVLMDLDAQVVAEVAQRKERPKGIRFSVAAFRELESAGHITRASGGPLGLDWFPNLPWFDKDIYAWCDPSFEGTFELPAA